MTTSEFGVVANVQEQDSCLRMGAKCFVIGVEDGRPKVHGISRGGRYVTKFVDPRRLNNPRPVWFPEHIRSMEECWLTFETKEAAQEWINQGEWQAPPRQKVQFENKFLSPSRRRRAHSA